MSRGLTREEFIDRSNVVHNFKFDYSESEYKKSCEKVCIICPEHGEFWQTPHEHLRGNGCGKCAIKKRFITTEEFIRRSNIVHNNFYNYSKSEYNGSKEKIIIICPKHNIFLQIAGDHLNGCGCPKCSGKHKYTTDEWKIEANIVHNNFFDYSMFKYINSQTKGCVICPKHGEFWITPNNHLMGYGCKCCYNSKMEDVVKKLFIIKNIKFECKYRNFEWLRNKRLLELDFYLPDFNVGIECQGEQHFKSIKGFGGINKLEYTQNNDKLKKQLCEQHNLPLYYINYNDNVEEKLNEILQSL